MKNTENAKTTKKNPNNAPVKPEPDPIGTLLLDALVSEIETFFAASDEERADACRKLFDITPYPAGLTGGEGAENYNVFMVQRTARMDRDDPTKHRRLSCDVVVTDKQTGIPMYFAKAYITPTDQAAVEVYCAEFEKGINYKRTLRWNNRPPRENG